jgi:quinol monooxygenase YgiN
MNEIIPTTKCFDTHDRVSRRDFVKKLVGVAGSTAVANAALWLLPGNFADAQTSAPDAAADQSTASNERNGEVSEIMGIARMKIFDGKLEEFKRISKQARDIVRAQDIGTLQYDVFLNAAGTEALVLERYQDEAALMHHHENMNQGGISEAILKTCSAEGELLGNISDNLAKALEGGPVRILSLWQSL